MKILDWLLGNWVSVIAGLLIIALSIFIASLYTQIGIKNMKIGTLEAKVQKQASEIEDWKKLYTILSDQLAEQNKSIENLKHRTEQAKKARRTADKKAAPIVSRALESENALRGVPASSGTCESELATINELLEAGK